MCFSLLHYVEMLVMRGVRLSLECHPPSLEWAECQGASLLVFRCCDSVHGWERAGLSARAPPGRCLLSLAEPLVSVVVASVCVGQAVKVLAGHRWLYPQAQQLGAVVGSPQCFSIWPYPSA